MVLDDLTMQTMLDEVLEHYSNPDARVTGQFKKMHPLAEAKYEPAKAFFVTCLDDKRSGWRYECLCMVGFHYDFSADDVVKDKLRYLLLHDEDDSIRCAAASSLGRGTKWPEKALFTALQTDNDPDVRQVAFLALLEHGGLPLSMNLKTFWKLHDGEIEPTLANLKEMLHSLDLNPEFPPDI